MSIWSKKGIYPVRREEDIYFGNDKVEGTTLRKWPAVNEEIAYKRIKIVLTL
jgi:hypothetical protein